MAEVLVEFPDAIVSENVRYHAHPCGAPLPDGTWQGWLEFVPIGGGPPIRTGRETTQPNRTDALYWATGLTGVYLEGAFQRALNPLVVHHVEIDTPVFDKPAPIAHATVPAATTPDAVLDPFAVYEKEGEGLLRGQLAALAAWHLVNIVQHYHLSDEPLPALNRLSPAALIERIVAAVRSDEMRAARHPSR
jgi:hypothetical protein